MVEPHTETRVLDLGDGSDVQVAALSSDGSRLALARGSKVALRTLEKKEERALELAAPVTALCFSPEGEWLAVGAASKLSIFAVADGALAAEQDASGAIRGIVWPGAKKVLALCEAKKARELLGVELGKKPKVATKALAQGDFIALSGRTLAVAAGTTIQILDPKLAAKTQVEAPGEVEALAVLDSKTLVIAAGGKAHRLVLGAKKQQWADAGDACFAAAAGKHYAVRSSVLVRCHSDEEAKSAPGFHTRHPQAMAVLPGGGIATGGWDGTLLSWSPEGGRGEVLHHQDSSISFLARDTAGERLFFNCEKTVRCLDLKTRKVVDLIEAMEEDMGGQQSEVESLAVAKGGVAWGDGAGVVHFMDFQGVEKWAVAIGTDDVESLCVDGEGNVWGGTEKGELGSIGPDGKLRFKRSEHGVDLITGEPYGNPHRSIAEMAAQGRRVATVASDGTVRVFDVSGERLLRLHANVGIFNTADFAPDGARLAFTAGSLVTVWDLATGERQLAVDLGATGLPGVGEAMAVRWLNARTLLVSTEVCGFFRVEIP
ncbi:MAG: hypothetical protein QM765_35795 [Myxococcales bacterium]